MFLRVIFWLIILLPSIVTAHSPIINSKKYEMTKANPFHIENPEHSKAIFSELNGSAEYYKMTSSIPFKFYVGITTPKLETCEQLNYFSFDILDSDFQEIDVRNGENFKWWPWYEKYGKTWYWVGPEIGKDFASNRVYNSGTYYIKVYNDTNMGQYALAVGDVEKFGITAIPKLLLTVRKLKKVFWNEKSCN